MCQPDPKTNSKRPVLKYQEKLPDLVSSLVWIEKYMAVLFPRQESTCAASKMLFLNSSDMS